MNDYQKKFLEKYQLKYDKDHSPVKVGDKATITMWNKPQKIVVKSIVAPLHEGSTGRVVVSLGNDVREFYPMVIEASWEKK